MSELWNTLSHPETFEQMTLLIQNRSVQSDVRGFLANINSARKPQTLLSAWLISRFPETVENTANEALLMAANNVKNKCLDGTISQYTLEVYANALDCWKRADKPNLEEQLKTAYCSLYDRSLETPDSNVVLQETRRELLTQARLVGGEELVSAILASVRK